MISSAEQSSDGDGRSPAAGESGGVVPEPQWYPGGAGTGQSGESERDGPLPAQIDKQIDTYMDRQIVGRKEQEMPQTDRYMVRVSVPLQFYVGVIKLSSKGVNVYIAVNGAGEPGDP